MVSPMGRRRKSLLDLPPRMHLKSGTYYYVTTGTPRKWIKLSKDLDEARFAWAKIESGESNGMLLSRMIDDWMQTEAYTSLSYNTHKVYRSVIKQLKAVFNEFSVQDIEPKHIAEWQDAHHSKVMSNTGKSILTTVLNIAVRKGYINRNPAKEIENIPVSRRKRYLTDEEYKEIRKHASEPLAAAMDISYATGARISDVISIRLQDITDEGLMIRQIKTKKLQFFKMTDSLKAAIDAAKKIPRPVRGMYLLCTLRGRPYQYAQMNAWWVAARDAAGVSDAHFHDIRGKSATDAKRLGQDYQSLLGHTTKAMSDSYIKLEDAQIVEPLRKIL